MRISDWSSDVCSSDLEGERREQGEEKTCFFLRHRSRSQTPGPCIADGARQMNLSRTAVRGPKNFDCVTWPYRPAVQDARRPAQLSRWPRVFMCQNGPRQRAGLCGGAAGFNRRSRIWVAGSEERGVGQEGVSRV